MTGELDGLLDAVKSYESDLQRNNVAALDSWFEDGDEVIRSDADGIVCGVQAISNFRRSRTPAASRQMLRIELRGLAATVAVAVIEVEYENGSRAVLTQVWRRQSDRWRIAVAQVGAPSRAIDGRVWRVVGDPLVAPTREGSLTGRTIAVKDLFAVAGHAIGAGNPVRLADAPVEAHHAAAVTALLDAGASIQGIARTDEFAYAVSGEAGRYGVAPNPAAPGAVPGGSSSGSASAVALGHADIGLGTDTAGSIRVPASYQGLWSLRATQGAVDTTGLIPLAPAFDAVGWLTRDPATLHLAAAASLRGSNSTPRKGLASLAVDARLLEVLPYAARKAFERWLSDVGGAKEVALGDTEERAENFRILQAAQAWETHGAWIAQHPNALAADVARRFAIASRVGVRERQTADEYLARARTRMQGELGDMILVLPATSSLPPRRGGDAEAVRDSTLRLTCIAGVLGAPAVTMPALEIDGHPLGISLVGSCGSDLALIETAAMFPTAQTRRDLDQS